MAHWFHGEACVTMFHFANAAMLPLVGQKLALADRDIGTALMSVCIVAAQIVMVPMAMLVGANADPWGRKPLFLAGFAILPIRGRSTRSPTTPIGWSACNSWTGSAPASSAPGMGGWGGSIRTNSTSDAIACPRGATEPHFTAIHKPLETYEF
jgi:hypothetical protein